MQAASKSELSALRQRVRALETGRAAEGRVLPFGAAAIDAALPCGGLALGALHEVLGSGGDDEDGALAAAFAAGIAGRLAGEVLWCLTAGDLYAPGLAALGLPPQRLIVARCRNDGEVLWAMEEGLREAALAAVIGEVEALPATAGRRLQLAAKASGVTALALRRWRSGESAARHRTAPSAAATRWRLKALPSAPQAGVPGVGRPLWEVELLRCRGGSPRSWIVEGCDAMGHVRLPAEPADRSPEVVARLRRAGSF
jgi:protein ImuA